LKIRPGDDVGRGQLLSTSTDDCSLLIALGVQLCVHHDGRLGVKQRRAVGRPRLINLSKIMVIVYRRKNVSVAVWHLVAQILYFIGAFLVLLAMIFSQIQLCCRRERASTIRTLSGILLFSCKTISTGVGLVRALLGMRLSCIFVNVCRIVRVQYTCTRTHL